MPGPEDQRVMGGSRRSPSTMTSSRSLKNAMRPQTCAASCCGCWYVQAISGTMRPPAAAVQFHADVARAGEDVDAVERVTWMSHVEFVLLIPGVESPEVQHDIPGQVGVNGIEPGRGPARPAGSQVRRVPLGAMHRERNRWVEHGPPGQLGDARADGACGVSGRSARRHELRGNVVAWNCVRRHDPARLPYQQGSGGVDDRTAAQDLTYGFCRVCCVLGGQPT